MNNLINSKTCLKEKLRCQIKKREIRHTGKNLTREGRKIIPKKKGRKKKEKQERKGVSQEEYIPKKGSRKLKIYPRMGDQQEKYSPERREE